MGVGVVLAAAGAGRRLGARSNKVLLPLAGKPIILHSLEVFAALKEVSEIVVVTRDVDVPYVKEITRDFGCRVISGGKTRQESVYLGLQALSDAVNWVIIHDGARPYLTKDTVLAVLEACYKKGAAGAAVPVTDTIKVVKGSRIIKTPPREGLWAMQTPQAFSLSLILKAHKQAEETGFQATDDCALIERLGEPVHVVMGEYGNIKITTPRDLPPKRGFLVGFGWDAHRLVKGRPLILGGVKIPYEKGLLGHSDADVVTHAVIDALLGAAGLGDIGEFFPDTDPAYEGVSSLTLLAKVKDLLEEKQAEINNVDITVMAEKPKMGPYKEEMKETLAKALGVLKSQINIKATTAEGLGFVGREEGLAAQSAVTLLVDL